MPARRRLVVAAVAIAPIGAMAAWAMMRTERSYANGVTSTGTPTTTVVAPAGPADPVALPAPAPVLPPAPVTTTEPEPSAATPVVSEPPGMAPLSFSFVLVPGVLATPMAGIEPVLPELPPIAPPEEPSWPLPLPIAVELPPLSPLRLG